MILKPYAGQYYVQYVAAAAVLRLTEKNGVMSRALNWKSLAKLYIIWRYKRSLIHSEQNKKWSKSNLK